MVHHGERDDQSENDRARETLIGADCVRVQLALLGSRTLSLTRITQCVVGTWQMDSHDHRAGLWEAQLDSMDMTDSNICFELIHVVYISLHFSFEAAAAVLVYYILQELVLDKIPVLIENNNNLSRVSRRADLLAVIW